MIRATRRGGPFPGPGVRTLVRRAERMLEHLGLERLELSLVVTGDDEIRVLNREHRRKDKATDVLSFPQTDEPSSLARGALLGDVVISIPTATRQARQRRRPLLDEVTMLLAHGILHLCGYDHRTDAEEREMEARTRELEAAANARRTASTPRPTRAPRAPAARGAK